MSPFKCLESRPRNNQGTSQSPQTTKDNKRTNKAGASNWLNPLPDEKHKHPSHHHAEPGPGRHSELDWVLRRLRRFFQSSTSRHRFICSYLTLCVMAIASKITKNPFLGLPPKMSSFFPRSFGHFFPFFSQQLPSPDSTSRGTVSLLTMQCNAGAVCHYLVPQWCFPRWRRQSFRVGWWSDGASRLSRADRLLIWLDTITT